MRIFLINKQRFFFTDSRNVSKKKNVWKNSKMYSNVFFIPIPFIEDHNKKIVARHVSINLNFIVKCRQFA